MKGSLPISVYKQHSQHVNKINFILHISSKTGTLYQLNLN